MAIKYGVNYTKEWNDDPSTKANKGTRNAGIKAQYEEATSVASGDLVYICKLQTKARFLGLESIVGALGAGAVKKIDKDGTATTIVAGDEVDGRLAGGYIIALTADGTTAASLKLIAKFLMD